MIVEIIQLFEFTKSLVFRLLMVAAILNIISMVSMFLLAKRHKPCLEDPLTNLKYTAIVPTHNEIPEVFDRCLASIKRQTIPPERIIVVISPEETELIEIARRHDCFIISKSMKKRDALAYASRLADSEFLLFVDSDTILEKDCVEELSRCFHDKNTALASPRKFVMRFFDNFAEDFSRLIEYGRHIIDSALHPCLVVADGKCNLWRRSAVISLLDRYINDKIFGKRVIIGEDRQLTRLALMNGWKTFYQPTAMVSTLSPPDTISLVKQQIRWARSGYLYWFRDIRDGLFWKVPLAWKLHTGSYFLMPWFLIVALTYDAMATPHLLVYNFFPSSPLQILINALILLSGLTLWTYFRKVLLCLPKKVSIFDTAKFGVFGFFAMFPVMLFSSITFANDGWLTRGGRNNSNGDEELVKVVTRITKLKEFLMRNCWPIFFCLGGSGLFFVVSASAYVHY